MIDLNDVQYDTFKPLEGKVFKIGPNGEAELTLAEVTAGGPSPGEGMRLPFSLVFKGPSGFRIQQGTYRFSCEGFGDAEIFITQTKDNAEGSFFQAVFG